MKNLEYRNGDKMPVLGLGTWKSDPGEVYLAVKEAISVGYRHIDCAPIYGNESEIGQAFSELFDEGVLSRDELWVTSKLWNDSHKKEDVAPALKKTLKDLQLDYLDLFLIHWPVVQKPGVQMPQSAEDFLSLDDVPLQETWEGMQECVKEGLAKHIGVSNFNISNIQGLLENDIPPEMNQVESHPYLQQNDLVDFCQSNNVHVTAYSPLGSPDRPVAIKGDNEPSLLESPVVLEIAKKHKASAGQVLIAWAIERHTAVIPKSVNPKRIRENLIAADLMLTADDFLKLERMNRDFRYVDGTFWVVEGNSYTLEGLWGN